MDWVIYGISAGDSFRRRAWLRFYAAMQRLMGVNAYRILVHQLAAENSRGHNQRSSEQRKVWAPRENMRNRIGVTQQPIERGQRQHHDGKNGMAPGGDEAANSCYQEQIDQADAAGNPATKCANAGQPQPGTCPELIVSDKVSDVGANHADQGRDRKVNQSRMNGVAADRHLAQYRFTNHECPLIGSECHARVRSRRWVRLTVLSSAFIPIFLSGCSGPFSALDAAGSSARIAQWLWWAMVLYATVVFLVVVSLWLYAIRRPHEDINSEQTKKFGRRLIIAGGVILPIVSTGLLLIFGIPAGHRMLPLAPEEGEVFHVHVTGHQWWWEVHYPDSNISLVDVVHIPAGVAVDVHLRSADVVHSFWVPRLAGKLDMIPGHTNVLRIQADEPGTYRGQCAEFCGTAHAHMKFVVHAHAPEDFDRWWRQAQEEQHAYEH